MDAERARTLSVADLSATPHTTPPLHPMQVQEEVDDIYASDPAVRSWAANVEEMIGGEGPPPTEHPQDSITPRPMEDVLVSPAVQEPAPLSVALIPRGWGKADPSGRPPSPLSTAPPKGFRSWQEYTEASAHKIREGLADTPPPEYPAQNPPPSFAPSKTNKQRSRVVPPGGGKRKPTGSPIRVDQDPIPERPAPVEERPEDSRNTQESAHPGPNLNVPFATATRK